MEGTDFLFDVVSRAYVAAPLDIRFVYTFWLVLSALYVFVGTYERMHNLRPDRSIHKLNLPYSVYLPGGASFLLYNAGIISNNRLPFDTVDFTAFLNVSGFVLLFVGLFLAAWGRVSMDGYWGSHIYKYVDSPRLVTTGAYKHIRHPIYLGQIGMAMGSLFVGRSWWILIFPLVTVPLNLVRARNEDRHLLAAFGESYQVYKDRTLGFWFTRASKRSMMTATDQL